MGLGKNAAFLLPSLIQRPGHCVQQRMSGLPSVPPTSAAARPVPQRRRPLPLSIVNPASPRNELPAPELLAELVTAVAQRADRQAFAVLFKHFAPRIKSYLLRAGATHDQAEDLTQETMVTLWRKASLFDARHAGVSTWIFTIARNLRVDSLRRQGGLRTQLDDIETLEAMPDEAPAPDEQLHTHRMEQGVRDALAHLPPEQAQVLRLSYYEDQPHAQIAQQLGIPLGTVKSRVRLAVAHLRRLLEKQP